MFVHGKESRKRQREAGSIVAPGAETVVCTGQANVSVTTVTDPTVQPLALVSVDTSGVSCTGALSRARYVNTGAPTLTRPLRTRDVVETTLAVQQDAPDGHLRARPALLTLNLVYDQVSGALLAVTGIARQPAMTRIAAATGGIAVAAALALTAIPAPARAADSRWGRDYFPVLSAPDELLAAGDPIARGLYAKYREVRMPNLRLGDGDVAALIDFLDEGGTASGPEAPSTAAR